MIDRRHTVVFSIHDVAPQTLPAVGELTRMVRAAAGPVPVSLLVVPRYHGRDAWSTSARDWLRAAADRGDEIVLHGYEHQTAQGVDGAEFARHMSDAAVRARLALALQRLDALDLRADGFIAPAYVHPAVLTRALHTSPVGWWATRSALHTRTGRRRVWSFGVGASTPVRRAASPRAARAALRLTARAPSVRLDLHPADIGHPLLRRTVVDLLAGLVDQGRDATVHGALVTPDA